MSVRVSAIVISHSQPEWLRNTLFALKNQTRPVDEIVAVDSSLDGSCAEIFREFEITKVIRRTDKNFADLVAAGVGQTTSGFVASTTANTLVAADLELINRSVGWYWLLHDDSAPEHSALKQLLAAADLSPSVALLGPKQFDPNSPKHIVQQGLTLTKLGSIFNLVDGDLDQGQHDSVDDVLAIGTAGALIRSDLYRRLQGFDRHAPNLASDIDFSLRTRLSGFRVIVVPSARVAHAALSLKGLRPRRWFGVSSETAKLRAEIHLQLAYLPFAVVWLYALLLPAIGFVRAMWRVARKQPNLILPELSAAFWAFGTLPLRLSSRSAIDLNSDIKLRSLWSLRASWSAVRHRTRSHQAIAFNAPGELSLETNSTHGVFKSFSGSGAWFITFGLLISSWQFWPTNVAAVGGALAPLSSDWFQLAARAGSSWQNSGLGLAAPSDPFNWLLTAIGLLWFLTPSLALAVTILLARSVAFAGAWHAFGLVSRRTWLRNIFALAYALWPAFLSSQNEGRVGAILTWMALPWLAFAVSKLLGASVATRVTVGQSSWLGASALLFAAVAVASTATGLLLAFAFAVLAAARPRRLGLLIWLPTLAVLLIAPFGWYLGVVLGHPLAIFADPGLPVGSTKQDFWQILLSVEKPDGLFGLGFTAYWPALFVVLAVLSWVSNRALTSATLTTFAALAAVAGYVLQRTDFASLSIAGSAASTSSLVALALLMAAAISLESFKLKWLRVTSGSLAVVASVVASLGFFGIAGPVSMGASSSSPIVKFTNGRTVPAIFEADARQGTKVRMLRVAQTDQASFEVQLVWSDGRLLESNSTAYRFALADGLAKTDAYLSVDSLVSNLVSANGANLDPAFSTTKIGYVLASDKDSVELIAALNSVTQLDAVGETEFGWLWRVKDAAAETELSQGNPTWSITKGIQLFGILVFGLLALPSRRAKRATGSGSIFSDSEFDENSNDFESNVDAAQSAEGRSK